ncbi:Piso0_004334 [Millerozyma farinosa CBS 7064]|uniref:Piso0_004334 protein n=1 Tax=Pichia sorbitophila (strain ATCC MYA-4447 / BCRC 22081 / CBS 7064 / NBRC 10061 / NRRL Y-12695) TaxID=559304 RepID=G8Y849_PICSO|nr:Piso0_004334 [Millerozyma farinosa CBS 7064]CCE84779.1 Piso0_004334 [Millerozyma farinosa CBS 7064]
MQVMLSIVIDFFEIKMGLKHVLFSLTLPIILFLAHSLWNKSYKLEDIDYLERLGNFITRDAEIIIPIRIRYGDEGFNFPDLIEATQNQIDAHVMNKPASIFNYKLIDDLKPSDRKYHSSHKGLLEYTVELALGSDNSVVLHPDEFKAYLYYETSAVLSNDLPFFITQVIASHLMWPDFDVKSLIAKPSFTHVILNVIYKADKSVSKKSEKTLRHAVNDLRDLFIPMYDIELIIAEVNGSVSNSGEVRVQKDTKRIDLTIEQDSSDTRKKIKLNADGEEITKIVEKLENNEMDNERFTIYTMVADFIIEASGDFEYCPSNLNLAVRSLQRHYTVANLLDAINIAVYSLRNKTSTSRGYKVPTCKNELIKIIDIIHRNENPINWSKLYETSKNLYHMCDLSE